MRTKTLETGPEKQRRMARERERKLLERFHLKDLRQAWPDAKIVESDDGWPMVYCGIVDGHRTYYSREMDSYVFTKRTDTGAFLSQTLSLTRNRTP